MTTETPPENLKRIWLAIGLGTILQAISFGSLLLGAVASDSNTPEAGGPAFAIGFAMVPLVLMVVAFGSGRVGPASSVLKGMGLWLLIALPISLVNPVTGICAGFAASGAVTLRRAEDIPFKPRVAAIVMVAAYVTVLVVMLEEAGVFAGAVTPLLAIRGADIWSERENARRGARSG